MVTYRFSFHFATAYVDPVQFLTAKDGYLRWASYPGITISEPVSFRLGRPDDSEMDIIDSEGMQKKLTLKWHWKWRGFEFGSGLSRSVRIWAVPFLSIVIPLTLLSAWLLLSKPKPAKQAETVPATASD